MKKNIRSIVSLVLVVFFAIGSIYLAKEHLSSFLQKSHFASKHQVLQGIQPYNKERDADFIKRMFKENWHWLIPEGQGFALEAFLALRPTHPGKPISTIKVLYVDDKPVGFVSYQKENFYKGELRFITVDEPYRGKGYSKQLMCHALQELRALGLSQVELNTRLDNKPALALYEKLEFKELWRNAPYVRFGRSLISGRCITNRTTDLKTAH